LDAFEQQGYEELFGDGDEEEFKIDPDDEDEE
jgi:hypothetical protein